MSQKGFVPIIYIIAVFVISGGVLGSFLYIKNNTNKINYASPPPALFSPDPSPSNIATNKPTNKPIQTTLPNPTQNPTPKVSPSPVPTSTPTPTPILQKKTIQVSISGKLYRDENCDSALQQSESGIAGIEMDIYQNGNNKLTTLTTDTNGDYRFSKDINEDETIVLEAQSVAPPGYKIYSQMSYSDVNKTYPDVIINLPRVPYESLGNCPLR